MRTPQIIMVVLLTTVYIIQTFRELQDVNSWFGLIFTIFIRSFFTTAYIGLLYWGGFWG